MALSSAEAISWRRASASVGLVGLVRYCATNARMISVSHGSVWFGSSSLTAGAIRGMRAAMMRLLYFLARPLFGARAVRIVENRLGTFMFLSAMQSLIVMLICGCVVIDAKSCLAQFSPPSSM